MRCAALPMFLAAVCFGAVPSHGREPKIHVNSIGMKLVWIEPGKFRMGSPKTEQDDVAEKKGKEGGEWAAQERKHEVRITRGYYLGMLEVTQDEYEQVMGANPSYFKAKKRPVEEVTWADAKAFCLKLSQREKKTYTLPTEAEWEYACRAGTISAFHYGETLSPTQANIDSKRKGTTEAGSFPANAWGLHDMHGNVAEWCEDWHDMDYYPVSDLHDPKGPAAGKLRVIRGGCWNYKSCDCRAAGRNGFPPEEHVSSFGFRVVLRPMTESR